MRSAATTQKPDYQSSVLGAKDAPSDGLGQGYGRAHDEELSKRGQVGDMMSRWSSVKLAELREHHQLVRARSAMVHHVAGKGFECLGGEAQRCHWSQGRVPDGFRRHAWTG